jgi:hypothetical protein
MALSEHVRKGIGIIETNAFMRPVVAAEIA